MKKVAIHTARWTLLLVFLFLILSAVFSGAARISLPFAGAYRAEIQEYVSTYLGKPVEIGSLELSWHKLGPRLVLDDIVLSSAQDKSQDVHLQKIYLDLDLYRSWLNAGWQIGEMAILGANLSVEYLGDKKLRIYGYDIDGNRTGDAGNLDVLAWLMQADSVALLDSRVRFINREKSIYLNMRELNIRAVNTDDLHQIRLDVDLPELSDEKTHLALDFHGSREDIFHSRGEFNLDLKGVDLSKVSSLIQDQSPVLLSGQAGWNLWGNWSEGSLQSLRVISNIDAPEFTNQSGSASWKATVLSSDLLFKREDDYLQIAVQKLSTDNKPGTDSVIQGRLNIGIDDGKSWKLEAAGPVLESSMISPLMALLDGINSTQKYVDIYKKLEPVGKLSDWHLSIEKKGDTFPRISAIAGFFNTGFNAVGKFPGFEGLDGRLLIRNNIGKIDIAGKNSVFDMPAWFRNSIQISEINGELGFQIRQDELIVKSSPIALSNEHLKGEVKFFVQKEPQKPAYIDISAKLDEADGKYAALYYPAKRMHPKLVDWLDKSVLDGKLTKGTLHIRGPGKGFPYANGEGQFTAEINVENGRLRYLPAWPEIQAIDARIEFQQTSMKIKATDGLSEGARLGNAEMEIRSFKKPVLSLQSNIKGEFSQLISFTNNSPLRSVLQPILERSTGKGSLDLQLALSVPLKKDLNKSLSYNGRIDFSNNRWRSEKFGFDLKNISGNLSFTENDLTSKAIRATYFNSPIKIAASTDKKDPDLYSRISISGDIEAKKVLQNYNIPVDQWVSGKSPWYVTLNVKKAKKNKRPQLSLQARSDLHGSSVDLPAPYDKLEPEKRPFRLSANFSDSGGSDRWDFAYGRQIAGSARVSNKTSRLEALRIHFGDTNPVNSGLKPGVEVNGHAAEFSFDGWIGTIAGLIDKLPASDQTEPIIPINSNLSVDKLMAGKIDTGPAVLSASTTQGHITTRLESLWLNGHVDYPRKHWNKDEMMNVVLVFMDKRFLDALTTSEGQGDRIDPRIFPATDITVQEFVWDEFQISDLKIRTIPVADGVKTQALGFVHDHMQMIGQAHWRLRDPQQVTKSLANVHHTDLSIQLQSDNIGKGMDNIGIGGAFGDGEGEVKVALSWSDAAYAPAFSDIAGNISIDLKKGRILAVEPGAAKILGLFALQTIPRRLLLDFKDVTHEGLLYDEISGRLDIANGIAETRHMHLSGPIGVVSSLGSTDFVSNTYDQKIVVIPRLSSTLPIIGLISGGAAAGVGVFIADQVLKGIGVNFDEIIKREYHLTGTWDNPQIKKIEAPARERIVPDNR